MRRSLLARPGRNLACASALLSLLACGTAHAALVGAIEYYNAALDHYFVTASPDEIDKLDAGFFVGWQRTGLGFQVYAPGSGVPGSVPVCRFYGLPSAGLDSHFYSASVDECNAVLQKFAGAWLLESSDVFELFLPDLTTGQCPAGSIPIYRSWNGRADSNHRYTTDPSVQMAMIARGYVAEGYGPPSMPVAMCSPTPSSGGGGGTVAPPVCNLFATASSDRPVVGAPALLSASCSGVPAGYKWTGCSSPTNLCYTSSSAAGTRTYSVSGINSGGTGPPASATIDWQPMPAPAPGLCAQFPSYLYSDVGWAPAALPSRDFVDDPGFAWNGAWAVRLAVPADAPASSGNGNVSAFEFGGPPTPREMTISRTPCDFRPTDPTGNNGPLVRGEGLYPSLGFVVGASTKSALGLAPGSVYFVNLRNWQVETGSISCTPEQGRCEAEIYMTLPR